jgi:hypothetical protein
MGLSSNRWVHGLLPRPLVDTTRWLSLFGALCACTGELSAIEPDSGPGDRDAGRDGPMAPISCREGSDPGAPPTVIARGPGASVTGESAELEIEIADADSDRFAVTFYGREITEEDDFTIVVLPDTQYYADTPRGWQRYFYDQTAWADAHREDYDIVAVIHNGDVVEHGNRDVPAWQVADRAFRTIEAAYAGFPQGIPYSISVGNHDQSPLNSFGGTARFNEYFGVSRFSGRAYYGGHYGGNNDESYITFSAHGLDFVVVSLQFATAPHPEIIAWARSIFEMYPEHFGILNSHYILNSDASFGTYGRTIYDGLRDVDNLQLMTCGHISAESRRSDDFEGNVVHSMLADYQSRAQGGSGYMRIWEFSPANDELTVRTYSPSLGVWETDGNSEFTLPVDLSGSGGPFVDLARIDPGGRLVSTTIDGLTPGRIYEWYARVSDCDHTVETTVARFRTE